MLNLTIKMKVWLALIAFGTVYAAGLLGGRGQILPSLLVLLAALVVGFFNAWRNK